MDRLRTAPATDSILSVSRFQGRGGSRSGDGLEKRAHGFMVLVLAGLLAGLGGGCAPLPQDSIRRMEDAELAYRSSRYDRAEQLVTAVIDAHADKPETAEALYLRGLCRIKAGKQTEARADLNRALRLTRRNDLVDLIHTQLGNLEFDQRRYTQAVIYYEPAYQDLPDRAPKDRVGFQYGIALQRSGRFARARSLLAEVAREFPTSGYATQARRKAAWPHQYFSIQCGSFLNISGAHQHASSLNAKGVNAVAYPDESSSPKRYVVRVGRYPTYAAAERHLARVQQVQSDAFVLP